MKLITSLLISLFFVSKIYSQPSNNNCSSSSAIELTPVASSSSGNATSCDTKGATQTYTPETCGKYTSTHAFDVFFKFKATQTSHTILVNPSSGYDPAVFVYFGSCTGTMIDCSDDGGGNGFDEEIVLNGLSVNTTYYIRVYDYDNTSTTSFFSTTFDIWVTAPPVSGSAIIGINPQTLNFGNIQLSTSSSENVILKNSGTSGLVINKIVYPSSEFTGVKSLSLIPAGSSTNLNITFNPISAKNYNADILIYSNASTSPDKLTVVGIGTNAPTPQITLSTAELTFGSVKSGNSSAPQPFTITNTGNATLNISSIILPFNAYTKDWNNGNIAPNQTQIINIGFSPISVGTYDGNIEINSNAKKKTLSLTGGCIAGSPTTITGIVKDVEVNWTSNIVKNEGLGNCTVKLKNSSGTVVTSTTTDSKGVFLLNAVSGSNYSIEASISDSYGKFSIGKTNVSVGSNIEILIPRKISWQIETLLNNLESLQMHISEFSTDVKVKGYTTSGTVAVLNNFKTFDNNSTKVKDNLTRLYLAQRILMGYYENAAVIGDEISTNFNAFLGIIGRIVSIISKVKEGNLFFEKPVESILMGCVSFAELILKQPFTVMNGPEKAALEGALDANLDALKYIISNNPRSIVNLATSPIKSAITALTPNIIYLSYIKPTQKVMDNASGLSSDIKNLYTLSNSRAIHQSKTNIFQVTDHSIKVKTEMEKLYLVNEVAKKLSDVTDVANGILTITGAGAGLALAIKTFGTAVSFTGYTCVGISCVKGFNEFRYLKSNVSPSIVNNAFLKRSTEKSIYYQEKADLNTVILSNAIENYNKQLYSIIDDVDYSREKAAFNKLDKLANAQSELNISIQQSIIPILAASPILFDSIVGFEEVYYNQFLTPLSKANLTKIGFAFDVMALVIDTTDYTTNLSIVSKGKFVIDANNALQAAILQFTNLSIGIPVPPYPAIVSATWEKTMQHNTDQILTIKYKNYGSVALNNSYVVISTTAGFKTTTDSLYLGTIAAGSTDSIVYLISSPGFDTVGRFHWQLNSSNGYGLGTGGVLATSKASTGIKSLRHFKKFDLRVTPNPCDKQCVINLNINQEEEVSFKVVDALGKVVIEQTSNGFTNSLPTINTSNLANGIYIITVISNGENLLAKFIVQH